MALLALKALVVFLMPKIFEFILENILIIGLITGTVLFILAFVKYIEYRDTKKHNKK